MWNSYFKGDLRYTYNKFLLKTLSSAEQYYLKSLRDVVDSTLLDSMTWVNDNKDFLKTFHTKEEFLEYIHDEEEFSKVLLTLANYMENVCCQPLSGFYDSGSRLAYNHLQKNPVPNQIDEQAKQLHQEYVKTLASSIHTDLTNNIINNIGNNIENNNIENITNDLLTINTRVCESYTDSDGVVVKPRFSTDTRLLYTTKTEYARAVNTGLLQAYNHYGVDSYDWVTTGLPNVCNYCKELENGGPYTLNEIINMIPVHVNCSCSVKARLPNNLHLNNKPQVIDLTPSKI